MGTWGVRGELWGRGVPGGGRCGAGAQPSVSLGVPPRREAGAGLGVRRVGEAASLSLVGFGGCLVVN